MSNEFVDHALPLARTSCSLLWLAAVSSVWPSILALLAIVSPVEWYRRSGPSNDLLGTSAYGTEAAAVRLFSGRLSQTRERRIAIFVPCWKESEVIGNMIRHNLAAICYSNFDFFIGAYPNNESTVTAAGRLAESYRNVHVAAVFLSTPRAHIKSELFELNMSQRNIAL